MGGGWSCPDVLLTVPTAVVTCRGRVPLLRLMLMCTHMHTYQKGRKRLTTHTIEVSGKGKAGLSSSSETASENKERSLGWVFIVVEE